MVVKGKFEINPFFKSNKSGILTIMIKISDNEFKNKLDSLYYDLTGKNSNKRTFHITLFSLFMNLDFIDENKLHNFKKIFNSVIKKEVDKLLTTTDILKIKYLDDNDPNNYDIYGYYNMLNNFFIKKFEISNDFRTKIEHIKKKIIKKIYGPNIEFHKSDKFYSYWRTKESKLNLFAIYNYYDYKNHKLPVLHTSLCRVKEIKEIEKKFAKIKMIKYNNLKFKEALKKYIFEQYLKDKTIKNDRSNIVLYPSLKNELIINYMDF